MAGNTYRPRYKKIFKMNNQRRFNSFKEILRNIDPKEIEVFCEIKFKNITIGRYLPYLYINDGNFLMEIGLDYFLDCEGDFEVGPKTYCDKNGYFGNKQLNGYKGWKSDIFTYINKERKPEKSLFVKTNHVINSVTKDEYDCYVKIRRVIIDDIENYPELTIIKKEE